MTNPNWQSFLASQGAQIADSADVLHFEDADAELRAAADGTVVAPLTHLGLIDCSGEDVVSFLHSQLTSDINHLEADRAQHSAWCTAKGRMLASFVVWKQDAHLRLALAAELVAPILKRLGMFVLRAKVKIVELSHEQVLIGVAGPQGGAVLASAGVPVPWEAMATAQAGNQKVIRLDASRFIIATPTDEAADLWRKLASAAKPVGVAAWRWLDIAAGLPLVTGPTREEFVPQMADFEKIGGVSFHKGCYPGQEIVARTQYLGKVKRHLFRLAGTEPLSAGDDLYSPENPDQSIGKVVTASLAPDGNHVALAVIQSNFAESVRLKAIDGPTIAATRVNP